MLAFIPAPQDDGNRPYQDLSEHLRPIGFLHLASAGLVVAKVLDILNWSWRMVLLPSVVALIIMAVGAGLNYLRRRWSR